ncbi:MFS transporter [Egicoccus halophilus]|uniref:MFS transporter n=1 Tax=Egicoccus halophilus TaxID=1670830 RepID=A0A8J3AA67_9ACTN|nr:MFS transporter [Egicoccus halophilus]GGI08789.1 MFS transporter [Egicoccus halophilus]
MSGGQHGALRVLRQRDFGTYFLGNSLSNIGTWFQNIAAGLLVHELTGSTLLVGAVNFAQFFGAFALAPLAGAAADRFDRRRLLIVTQVAAASVGAVLALLTLTGRVTAAVVVGAAGVLGLALAFMVPALLALVPLLVEPDDLDAALSLNSVTFNLARAVGPVLGALVVERAGYGVAFALNAASFLAFVAALMVVRPRPQRRTVGVRPSLFATVRTVRDQRTWAALLVAVMALSTTTDPINTLTPELAREVFGGSDLDAGLLVAAFGTGATLTAFTLLGWLRRRRHALVGAMVVQGVGMALLAVAPTLPLAMAALAVSGGGFLAGVTRSTVRLQSEVPAEELGRVMALWSLAFVGTRPFAALLDGAVAEVFGARAAALVMALPVLIGALWVHRVLREDAQTTGGGRAEAR